MTDRMRKDCPPSLCVGRALCQPALLHECLAAAVAGEAGGDDDMFDQLVSTSSPLLISLLAGASAQSRVVCLPSSVLVTESANHLQRRREELLRGLHRM